MAAGTIKPWQMATLGMMGGLAVYGGLLDSLKGQTQTGNQQAATQVRQEQQQAQYLIQLKQDKQVLQQLQQELQHVKDHTARTERQIAIVKHQMALMKVGAQVSLSPASGRAAVSSVSVAIPSTPAPTSAPPVQTTTRASGA